MIVYKELSSLCHDLGYSSRALYSLSNDIESHYYEKIIPKKNGDERTLHVPDKFLKSVQHSIADKVLFYEPVSKHAMAYRIGRSIATNARYHVGREMILKLDISKFFDHITYEMVKEKVFSSERFSEANRVLLAILCTYKNTTPQGAPTSPVISNIIMRDFDAVVGEYCESRNILYTRYCDDLTFSGSFNVEDFIELVKQELKKEGFRLNTKKSVVLCDGQRKEVTGLVVNEKLSVPRYYKKKLRQEVYYCKKYGVEEHMARKGYDSSKDTYIESLIGKINYVLSIEKDNIEFRELLKEINVLFRNKCL